ncbi:hypothetical protein METBIDRAFT_10074 [Metschnikowia bicuspidata var. bicuspidata NRRL YB-4993]|uniref:Uncharacterized protein n=1 Tax=Metschnikowia bicuspidata var. bicuspidata NRRL YB-4993 TaxID=869754 RepID=A0A1A0HIN0_9ASCO|nr:hypothetical protein METBIDRAFT_10074 [Metschnikowia bicuspidata var. bicuspidata NRRL YB-4993]OBA23861.1 hypothetical protein METBIDRAFT_10074 [Metschnikowia bicuspidata var. bicuspidata NRRL YB-4993]
MLILSGRKKSGKISRISSESLPSAGYIYQRLGSVSPGSALCDDSHCLPPTESIADDFSVEWEKHKQHRRFRKSLGKFRKRFSHRPKWLKSGLENLTKVLASSEECAPLLSEMELVFEQIPSTGGLQERTKSAWTLDSLAPSNPVGTETQYIPASETRWPAHLEEDLIEESAPRDFATKDPQTGDSHSLSSAGEDSTEMDADDDAESEAFYEQRGGKYDSAGEIMLEAMVGKAGKMCVVLYKILRFLSTSHGNLRHLEVFAPAAKDHWSYEYSDISSVETEQESVYDSEACSPDPAELADLSAKGLINNGDAGSAGIGSSLNDSSSVETASLVEENPGPFSDLPSPLLQIATAKAAGSGNMASGIGRSISAKSGVESPATGSCATSGNAASEKSPIDVEAGDSAEIGLVAVCDAEHSQERSALAQTPIVEVLGPLSAEQTIASPESELMFYAELGFVFAGAEVALDFEQNSAAVGEDARHSKVNEDVVSQFETGEDASNLSTPISMADVPMIEGAAHSQESCPQENVLQNGTPNNVAPTSFATSDSLELVPILALLHIQDTGSASFVNQVQESAILQLPVEESSEPHSHSAESKKEAPILDLCPAKPDESLVMESGMCNPCSKISKSWADYDSDAGDSVCEYFSGLLGEDAASIVPALDKEDVCKAQPQYRDKPALHNTRRSLTEDATATESPALLNLLLSQISTSSPESCWKSIFVENFSSGPLLPMDQTGSKRPPLLSLAPEEEASIVVYSCDDDSEPFVFDTSKKVDLASDSRRSVDASDKTTAGDKKEDSVENYRDLLYTDEESWMKTEFLLLDFEEEDHLPLQSRARTVRFATEADHFSSDCESSLALEHNREIEMESEQDMELSAISTGPFLSELESLVELETALAQIAEANSTEVAHQLTASIRKYRLDFLEAINSAVIPCNEQIKQLARDVLAARNTQWELFSLGSAVQTEISVLSENLRDADTEDCRQVLEKLHACGSMVADMEAKYQKTHDDFGILESNFRTRFTKIMDTVNQIISTRDRLLETYDEFCELNVSNTFSLDDISRCVHVDEFEKKTTWHYYLDFDEFETSFSCNIACLLLSMDVVDSLVQLVRGNYAEVEQRLDITS